ncbi:MAG: glycosyltransferase [Rhodospirillales bacterium]|nr:glycosyltransferase [Rhodospirillales bacterium]
MVPFPSPDTAPFSGAETSRRRISVVVPVLNEQDNVDSLIREIRAALDGRESFEIVYVDDGSTDETLRRLEAIARSGAPLRIIKHARRCGQSAALASGIRAATGGIVVTLDGDGQNDPADIPALLRRFEGEKGQAGADFLLVAGFRRHRMDTWVKRCSSRIANTVRARLLGDATADTGCGLKIFTRAAFMDLPRFDHMHRFLPALMLRRGGRVVSVPVNHRPRAKGRSKYGTFDRLAVGIVDLFGVMWLMRRGKIPEIIDRARER